MQPEVGEYIRQKGETLLVDVAIHFMLDPEETRALVEPLVASGRVERFWRPMTTPLRILCDCDREEVLRWVGGEQK